MFGIRFRSIIYAVWMIGCCSILKGNTPPNVIVILMDDFGVGQFAPEARQLELKDLDPAFLAFTESLGSEGYDPNAALQAVQQSMPFMDKLVGQGVLFRRAFSASNLCAPARQSLLTGTSPTRWGAYRNIDINVCGFPEGRSLALHFQDLGYRTGFVGKWHVGQRDNQIKKDILAKGGSEEDAIKAGFLGSVVDKDHPDQHGFDYYFGYNRWECPYYDSEMIWENRTYTGLQKQYNTDLFTDKAMDFMRDAIGQNQPFLIEVAYHTAHIPLNVDAPEKYMNAIQTGDQKVDQFYSHIYAVDHSIKRMVEMLQDQGVWQNTILFFTADNGATCKIGDGDLSLIPGNGPHRGHKGQFYLGGVRIPLVMVWPEGIKEASEVRQNVSIMDILPTALAAAGGDSPQNIDGKDLMSVIQHPTKTLHPQLFFAGIHAPAWGFSGKGVIGGNAQARRDESPGGWAVVQGDWIMRYIGSLDAGLMKSEPEGKNAFYSLHRLVEDPLEVDNRVKEHPEISAKLIEKFSNYAKELPPPHRWDRKRWQELVNGAEQ